LGILGLEMSGMGVAGGTRGRRDGGPGSDIEI
jgi:hypothetical protein